MLLDLRESFRTQKRSPYVTQACEAAYRASIFTIAPSAPASPHWLLQIEEGQRSTNTAGKRLGSVQYLSYDETER